MTVRELRHDKRRVCSKWRVKSHTRMGGMGKITGGDEGHVNVESEGRGPCRRDRVFGNK